MRLNFRSLLLIAFSFGICHSLQAQSCLGWNSMKNNPSDIYPAGSDGLVRTTYAFVDANGSPVSPDPNVSASFSGAVSQWNAQSATTGVQFIPAPSGQQPDIQIQQTADSTGNTQGCAAYKPASTRIYYGETFLRAAQSNSTGSTIFAHELGHELGLNDGGVAPNPPSIMNNPSNSAPANCTSPVIATSTVQASDASGVASCIRLAHNYQAKFAASENGNYDLGPTKTIQTFAPTCSYQ